MNLCTATYAYPRVPGEERAQLSSRLARAQIPQGVFVLTTCLRIEVVVQGDRTALDSALGRLLGDEDLPGGGVIRSNEDAVHHVFRVAAGLESPIVGEREILTQFRQTLTSAEEAGTVGGLLSKLLEASVAVGRQARALLPESPHDSMAAVAAQLVGAADRVAVLGAGAMGRAVAENLLALPAPPEVTMIVRSPENVVVPGVELAPMAMAVEALERWPAVVSATSARGRLLPDQEVTRILSSRPDPLTLVDLAMPPDLTTPLDARVTHFDVDDIARRSQRRVDTQAADAHVLGAAAETFRLIDNHHEIGPVIGEMMRSADEIVERTVDRFAGRLGGADDQGVLRQTAHTVARTLLAKPVSYLRSTDRPPDAVDVLAEAFGLGVGE